MNETGKQYINFEHNATLVTEKKKTKTIQNYHIFSQKPFPLN